MEGLFSLGGVLAVVFFFLGVGILRSLIRVCPPDQVLVVTGIKTQMQGKEYGFRIQKGGWTFVLPYLQSVEAVDLSVIPINVRIEGLTLLTASPWGRMPRHVSVWIMRRKCFCTLPSSGSWVSRERRFRSRFSRP